MAFTFMKAVVFTQHNNNFEELNFKLTHVECGQPALSRRRKPILRIGEAENGEWKYGKNLI